MAIEGEHNPFSPSDNPLAVYVWVFLFLMAIVPLVTVIFLFTAPSHYDPYNPDFVEEIRPDRTMADLQRIEEEAQTSQHKLPRPGEGYAHFNKHRETNKKLRYANSVTIVVLGDLSRSPRMLYHAASLASKGVRVELVGYVEDPLPTFLKRTKHIRVHPLSSLPYVLTYLPFVILAPLKLMQQSWALYRKLCYGVKTPTRFVLLQVPPSMPTLHVCLMACFSRNSKLICDWHNTGSSILALRFRRNQNHPVVRLARRYELGLARRATGHLTVSGAMKQYLIKEAKINPPEIAVMRDRPAEAFKPLDNARERSDFLRGCEVTAEYAKDLTMKGGWKLLVSSTSWTADEDFSILLDSLMQYSSRASNEKALPNLVVVITGKGPQQARYLRQISQLNQQKKLEKVIIRTAFLPHADYAKLLACADLGVCLHNSSSGLDLPMKVVDMFGAGLPVVAYGGYEAWHELVKDGVNGEGFESSEQLAEILMRLLGKESTPTMQKLVQGAREESKTRWETEWDTHAGQMLGVVPLS